MTKKIPALLKDKALSSLRRSIGAFNSFDDDGRETAVLLHAQHSFEMLLKAALRQKNRKVFTKESGRSIGFEKCLNLAREHLRLTDEQIGLLRTIDALRDDEQHYLCELNEELLFVHIRGAVTLFDEILQRVFGERLADHLPERALPITTEPPRDIEILVNEQFDQVRELLSPGKRRRPEARAKIRGLLAMEGHMSPGEAHVSESDVNRVERGIKAGKSLESVFPRLGSVGATYSHDGPTLLVHFSRSGDGAPVHYVAADDPTEAAAVREIDLHNRFRISRSQLAQALGLSPPRALALRRHLGIDDDSKCMHVFTFDKLRHYRYSDEALRRMKEALKTVDMDEVWATNRPRRSTIARREGG